EARAWHAAEGVVQLGFASLLMDGTPSAAALAELRLAIERERETLGELASVLVATPDPDVARVNALCRIRTEHPGARVIAFSEFASTITSLYSAMRGDAGVGMLTARHAKIASGRIARDDLLARFAPVAQHARAVAAHESVTLLLTTDLLSEGVNLQDASVVVHLDLPWNPARLAQRVGRLRRPGGARVVRSYLLAPPARAQLLLDADARLRRKLAAAEQVVGRGIGVLPPLARESASTLLSSMLNADAANATEGGVLTALLEQWRAADTDVIAPSEFIVAAVASHTAAWLAALGDGRMVSSLQGIVSGSPAAALRVSTLLDGTPYEPGDDQAGLVLADLTRWLDAEGLATTCGLDAPAGAYRRAVFHWLEALMRDLPRHQRANALPLVGRLRLALQSLLPLGAERRLAVIASNGATDESALLSALAVVESHVRHRSARPQDDARVVGLVIAAPEHSAQRWRSADYRIEHGTLVPLPTFVSQTTIAPTESVDLRHAAVPSKVRVVIVTPSSNPLPNNATAAAGVMRTLEAI
ncbi:MAG: helicase-related protein, partial [bacterium]